MAISNFQTLAFALTPGSAENLEREATASGNFSMCGLAERAKNTRNIVYGGVASTAIAITVEIVFNKNTTVKYTFAAVAIFGTGVTAFFAKILYETASEIQSIVNRMALNSNLSGL